MPFVQFVRFNVALFAPAVPPDGRYQVAVTFEDPGTYTIRCLASDGALNTAKDTVVTVTK